MDGLPVSMLRSRSFGEGVGSMCHSAARIEAFTGNQEGTVRAVAFRLADALSTSTAQVLRFHCVNAGERGGVFCFASMFACETWAMIHCIGLPFL